MISSHTRPLLQLRRFQKWFPKARSQLRILRHEELEGPDSNSEAWISDGDDDSQSANDEEMGDVEGYADFDDDPYPEAIINAALLGGYHPSDLMSDVASGKKITAWP